MGESARNTNIAGGGGALDTYCTLPHPTQSLFIFYIFILRVALALREVVGPRVLPPGPAGNELFRRAELSRVVPYTTIPALYDDDPRWILNRLSPMGKDLFERACTGLEDF